MLAAISVCHMLNDVIQSLILAIYPLLKTSLALDFAQIGFITFTFQATASVLQPLVGYLTDRYPTPYSLVVGMGASLIGLVLIAFASTYAVVLVAAALIGMGSSVFHPESSRVARLASGGRHGTAQAVFQVGGNFGTALGPLLAALIVIPYGQGSIAWFSVVALLGMVLLSVVGTWYGKALKIKPVSHPEEREAIAALGRRKVAKAILILITLTFSKHFYLASIASFYIFYLIHTFDLSVQSAQLYLFLFLGAVAAGTVIGGPIGDRIGTRRVIWWSILGVLPFTLALPYVGAGRDRRAERRHRRNPGLRPPGHHRLCAKSAARACRHGRGALLRSRVRGRRDRCGAFGEAGRCHEHHLRLSRLRFSTGDRAPRRVLARDVKAKRTTRTKKAKGHGSKREKLTS